MEDQRSAPRHRSSEVIDDIVARIIGQANGPISAYSISARAETLGSSLVPNQVYRTLARLSDQGRIVKIVSLAAFVPKPHEAGMWLICQSCHRVEPLACPGAVDTLRQLASRSAFAPKKIIVEIYGVCGPCVSQATKFTDTPTGGNAHLISTDSN